MADLPLEEQAVLITGAARRVGRALALAAASAGADIFLHFGRSDVDAQQSAQEIRKLGRQAWLLQQDLSATEVESLVDAAWKIKPFTALVNSAAIFEDDTWDSTTRKSWQRHLDINLSAPFFLSQAFARRLAGKPGRIVNILDWRALRPGADHFAYTVSKAALASLTLSLAIALTPNVTVNGLALGAILPPSDGASDPDLIARVPAKRWGTLEEVGGALVYLLSETGYTTGSIIHIDGGRHLA